MEHMELTCMDLKLKTEPNSKVALLDLLMLAHRLAILVYRVKSVHVVWKHCNDCHYLVQQTIFFQYLTKLVPV